MAGKTIISNQTTTERIKSIIGGSLGNLVEWYDWYVYTAFSLYFSGAFFPKENQTVQLLNTAGIFAIGFLMLPIGGWVMGAFADKKGRKAALTLSVLLMSVGSLIIAVVPGYKQIGIAAPLLLVLARIIQGLSVGGEYGTSATYLSEMATKKHRGFYSSFQYVTLIMGQLIALGVLVLLQRCFLTDPQLHQWGWRIPFGIGAVLAITVMYLRRSLQESVALEDKGTNAGPARGTLRALMQHPKAVLTVIGLTVGGTVAFYTFTTYMQKFLVNTSGFSKNTATLISSLTLVVFMLVQPLFGLLSDKIGRKPLLIAFGILGALTTVPIMTALSTTKDEPRKTEKEKNDWKIFLLDWLQPNIRLSALKAIKCPSLIICGDRDLIPVEHTVLIYQNIPKSFLWVVPNSGHPTLIEHADDFNKNVDSFFVNDWKR